MRNISTDKNFLKGTIWNTLGSTMYGINSFIMLALVSRVGTVEEAGYFGIAFTTAQLMYIVGLFGMNHYQQTDYQEKYSLVTYIKAKLISTIFMVVGCFASIACLRFSGVKAIYMVMLTLLMILNSVGEMFQSFFFQKNRLDLSGGMLFFRTLWSLLAFSGSVIFFKNILLAVALQIVVNIIITVFYVIKYIPMYTGENLAIRKSWREEWKLIGECLPLFVSMMLMNVVINSSKYGIEFLMDDVAQGYYNMIFIPAQVINLCSQFLFKPLLNQYSKLLCDNYITQFMSMLKKQILLVVLFTVACCVMTYIAGVPILGFVYNKNLASQKTALTMVVLGGGVYALCQLFYYIFVILRKQEIIMRIYIIGLVTAVGMTALMVAGLGINGAALSFIVTHIIIFLCYFMYLKRELKMRNQDK